MNEHTSGSIGENVGELLDSRPVFDGRIVRLAVDRVRFPDGTVGELEMIRHSGAAAVLPVLGDPSAADPEIVMIRQYRYAAGGFIYEVPAGRPDQPGEDWEVCARRELEEETGYRAGTLRYLTAIHTTPGFTDEKIHLFLATELSQGPPASTQTNSSRSSRWRSRRRFGWFVKAPSPTRRRSAPSCTPRVSSSACRGRALSRSDTTVSSGGDARQRVHGGIGA
jgi:8-oxo-dGTP pyrophosphatase MutT (NUDIX family)